MIHLKIFDIFYSGTSICFGDVTCGIKGAWLFWESKECSINERRQACMVLFKRLDRTRNCKLCQFSTNMLWKKGSRESDFNHLDCSQASSVIFWVMLDFLQHIKCFFIFFKSRQNINLYLLLFDNGIPYTKINLIL